MIIVCNAGLNIPEALRVELSIEETPQLIVVDGTSHDIRSIAALSQIDAWFRSAKETPYLLPPSAADYVDAFRRIAETDHEIVVVTGPRKMIGSFDTARAAARTLASFSAYQRVKIAVVDGEATDIGAGMIAIYCGLANKAGFGFDGVVQASERLASAMVQALVPRTLDFILKNGRTTFLKAMAANMLNVAPVLTFVDGEPKNHGMISKNSDPAKAIADYFVTKLGVGRTVWVSVAHGDDPPRGEAMLSALRERFDVRGAIARPSGAAAFYVNVGPGYTAAWALPIDAMTIPVDLPSSMR